MTAECGERLLIFSDSAVSRASVNALIATGGRSSSQQV
ncbi:hypothetical protein BSLA_03r0851 [Burkholderia stabilis]|nr:hypothetical protein BSLA_03r0851 [Burkholderia stabilis]